MTSALCRLRHCLELQASPPPPPPPPPSRCACFPPPYLRPVILFDRELDRFNSLSTESARATAGERYFEVFVAQRFPFRPHRSSWQPWQAR
eukprot:761057-Hanusia_phi.AAC.4